MALVNDKLNPRKFIESIVSENKSIPKLIIYFLCFPLVLNLEILERATRVSINHFKTTTRSF